MAFQPFNPPPPTTTPPPAAASPRSTPRRCAFPDDVDVDSSQKTKQHKRVFSDEEEYLAGCLVMLSRGGGGSAALETAPADQNNHYECGVCGKVFQSYQALGGHKTRHRKKPRPASAPASTALDRNGRVYECAICHKSFRMAQALGGHKRKHYRGVIRGRIFGGNGDQSVSDGGGSSSGVTAASQSGGEGGVTTLSLDRVYLAPKSELDLTLHL